MINNNIWIYFERHSDKYWPQKQPYEDWMLYREYFMPGLWGGIAHRSVLEDKKELKILSAESNKSQREVSSPSVSKSVSAHPLIIHYKSEVETSLWIVFEHLDLVEYA